MENRDTIILSKIQDHIDAMLRYCAECHTLDDFQKDPMRVEACVFNMMQIGELAKNALSDEVKAEIVSIPWKQVYGMRNRIVHGYSGVDMSIVWDTIRNDLPGLKMEIEKYL